MLFDTKGLPDFVENELAKLKKYEKNYRGTLPLKNLYSINELWLILDIPLENVYDTWLFDVLCVIDNNSQEKKYAVLTMKKSEVYQLYCHVMMASARREINKHQKIIEEIKKSVKRTWDFSSQDESVQ